MGRKENLMDIREVNARLTQEERRERASRAGKASAEARRRKANFNKSLHKLLTAEVKNEEWEPVLKELGLECTLETIMLAGMIKKAILGDVRAAEFVARYSGQSASDDLTNKIREMDMEIKKGKPEEKEIKQDESLKEMEEYFERRKRESAEADMGDSV